MGCWLPLPLSQVKIWVNENTSFWFRFFFAKNWVNKNVVFWSNRFLESHKDWGLNLDGSQPNLNIIAALQTESAVSKIGWNAHVVCDFVVFPRQVKNLHGQTFFLMKHILVFHVFQRNRFVQYCRNNACKTQLRGKCQNLDTVFAYVWKIGTMKMCVPTTWKICTNYHEWAFVSRCKYAFFSQGQIGYAWRRPWKGESSTQIQEVLNVGFVVANMFFIHAFILDVWVEFG